MSPKDRSALIHRVANILEKRLDDFAHLESADNGKPFGFAQWDLGFAVDTFRYYAGWPDKLTG